jgi:hypothetical protein
LPFRVSLPPPKGHRTPGAAWFTDGLGGANTVAVTVDGPPNLIDAGPLYAGECIDRITDIRPAGELVRELAP